MEVGEWGLPEHEKEPQHDEASHVLDRIMEARLRAQERREKSSVKKKTVVGKELKLRRKRKMMLRCSGIQPRYKSVPYRESTSLPNDKSRNGTHCYVVRYCYSSIIVIPQLKRYILF